MVHSSSHQITHWSLQIAHRRFIMNRTRRKLNSSRHWQMTSQSRQPRSRKNQKKTWAIGWYEKQIEIFLLTWIVKYRRIHSNEKGMTMMMHYLHRNLPPQCWARMIWLKMVIKWSILLLKIKMIQRVPILTWLRFICHTSQWNNWLLNITAK